MKLKIVVDRKDAWLLSAYRWRVNGKGYAMAGRKGEYLLHVLIMKPPKGKLVDHANGDRLDNRRSNLRVCNRSQNNANRVICKNNKSRLKGVCYNKGCWQAQIKNNNTNYYLGCFGTKEEAHIMYCFAAQYYFGEFANPGYI